MKYGLPSKSISERNILAALAQGQGGDYSIKWLVERFRETSYHKLNIEKVVIITEAVVKLQSRKELYPQLSYVAESCFERHGAAVWHRWFNALEVVYVSFQKGKKSHQTYVNLINPAFGRMLVLLTRKMICLELKNGSVVNIALPLYVAIQLVLPDPKKFNRIFEPLFRSRASMTKSVPTPGPITDKTPAALILADYLCRFLDLDDGAKFISNFRRHYYYDGFCFKLSENDHKVLGDLASLAVEMEDSCKHIQRRKGSSFEDFQPCEHCILLDCFHDQMLALTEETLSVKQLRFFQDFIELFGPDIRTSLVNMRKSEITMIFNAVKNPGLFEYLVRSCEPSLDHLVPVTVTMSDMSKKCFHHSLLSQAAATGNAKVMSLLLEHGVCVNTHSNTVEPPLFLAALAQHEDIVKMLWVNGADVNARSPNNMTSVMYAHKSVEITKLLIEAGFQLTDDRETMVCLSVCSADEILRLLMAHFKIGTCDKIKYLRILGVGYLLNGFSTVYSFPVTGDVCESSRKHDTTLEQTKACSIWQEAYDLYSSHIQFMSSYEINHQVNSFSIPCSSDRLACFVYGSQVLEDHLGLLHPYSIDFHLFWQRNSTSDNGVSVCPRLTEVLQRLYSAGLDDPKCLPGQLLEVPINNIMDAVMEEHKAIGPQNNMPNILLVYIKYIDKIMQMRHSQLKLCPSLPDHCVLESSIMSNFEAVLHTLHKTDFIEKSTILRIAANVNNFGIRNKIGGVLLHSIITLYERSFAVQLIKGMLAHGADANILDDVRNTPLHCLRTDDKNRDVSTQIATLLLEHGAHLDVMNIDGMCAIKIVMKLKMLPDNNSGMMNNEQNLLSSYRTLQCMCATQINISNIPYENYLPTSLCRLVSIHKTH